VAIVALYSRDEKSREELRLAVEERGHSALRASDEAGLLETVRSQRPHLALIVESGDDAAPVLAAVLRSAPLLPVVVALKPRSAVRALELMRLGAFEVVAAPWTQENLAAALAKAERTRGTEFEVVRPGLAAVSGKRPFAILLAVLAVLAAAGAFWAVRTSPKPPPAPRPSEWPLPYNHPAGLAFHNGRLWVSDWFSQTLYQHDPGSVAVVRAAHFPAETPGALVFAVDALWTASGPRSLVKHMLDEKLSVLARVDDLAPQTVGMAYDGLYLWTCDGKAGRLHKRIFDDRLSIVSSYKYPGVKPAALTYDGRSLWSLDSGNRELIEHDIANPEKVLRRVALPEYKKGGWKPMGLAFDGKRFWSVAESSPKGEDPARLFEHLFAIQAR
jgi:ActR/RegA family two-component response regulator